MLLVLFGGSFDPVHLAHVGLVEGVSGLLSPDQIRVLPCHIPPHKPGLHASVAHRLAMLRLAFSHMPAVVIDEREVSSSKVSYSFDSVSEIRQEVGATASVCFLLGEDSWVNFSQWHRWQEILQRVNLLVVKRPGAASESCPQAISDYAAEHSVPYGDIARYACGKVAFLPVPERDIASTQVREGIKNDEDLQAHVPAFVADYIQRHALYC